MPYPQPVSPVSLETCPPPPSEIDSDDLIASDDELDDVARAAKRQRVEKLAQSYLEGRPLLILSASLRGPFNEGWINPWKKTRTRESGGPARIRQINVPERVVQETDLRAPKYREGLSVGTRRPEIPATSCNSPRTSVQTGDRSSPSKSPHRQSKEPTPRRSPTKSKQPPSSTVDDHSIMPPRTVDWLKKNRKLMNFTKFEPPSSPTISVASRQSDKARRPMPRSVQVQVPQTPGSPMKFPPIKAVAAKTDQGARMNSKEHPSPRSNPLGASNLPKVPSVPKLSPFEQYHQSHLPQEASLRIVNSSSQLPRFEYRRWLRQHSSQQEKTSPMQDESILQEETFLQEDSPLKEKSIVDPAPASPSPARDQALDSAEPEPEHSAPEEISVHNEDPAKNDASHKTLSKETRFADEEDLIESNLAASQVAAELDAVNEEDTATLQNTDITEPIEHNTYDDLPSAQQVPPPLGVSDRVTSLHSTALPRENSGLDSPSSHDTQLSTQAALIHAQKSFQDDLDSPEYYNQHTPNPDRAVHSPNASFHSANVTPFYRLEESIRRDLERSSKSMNKDGMPAMSTQFMLDAATPFNFSTEQAGQDRSLKPTNRNMTQMNTQFMLDAATPYAFSTEKRQRASRPDSGSPTTRNSKRKKTVNTGSPSPSTRSQSTSVDNENHTAESQSGEDEGSPQSAAQQLDQQPTYQSATEVASLPLTLSGSVPTTGQDGQGVHQGMESFNLSQAIADAGSWLQQSFDFMKDSARPSQHLKAVPTSDAQPSPINMDLSQ
ncbi:hypothetical protein N7489_000361 [Penicillium chrysogenum]|jgi:hypothetical protein|uniref:uncharacterized protein n=1 Tax=Penicillium chrysogenum TaxID=5076 RepID=UPI0024DF1D55|nr:uncharacterized protein N7489_000361 [Penicillium chrysogenum]KAJ5249951.1 hypothetical protein N7489_000361 [Penicillium chrysogenum]